VLVRTSQSGTVVIEPLANLRREMNVSLTNGVHEVQEGVPFRLFLVNFSDEVVCLPVGQSVVRVLPGQPRAYPTPLRLADVLGIDPIDAEGDSS